MDGELRFKCVSDIFEEIPKEVVEKTKVSFPEAHTNSKEMCILAKALKEYHKEEFVLIPFCMTVEAEALGAKVTLGDEKTGPRVSTYSFNNIDEVLELENINYTKNRIKEVLDAVEKLSKEGEVVVLSVQGPYTIAQYLLDPKVLFKAARKEREKVDKLLSLIEDSVVDYIKEGIKRGAKIISYGDSSGTLDILGPKMYTDFSGKYNVNVLRRAKDLLGDQFIHVCGVTSVSLHNSGLIKSVPIECEEGISYGQAIESLIKERKDLKVIGHNCIKRMKKKMLKPVVWSLEL